MIIFDNGLKTPLVRSLALVSTGITAFVCSGLYFDWSKSDSASWVQAVGSIAAIFGAARIAGSQSRSDDRRALQAEIQNDLAVARVLKSILERAMPILTTIETSAEGARWEELAVTEPALDIFKGAMDVVYARAISPKLTVAATTLLLGVTECLVTVRRAMINYNGNELPRCESIAKANAVNFETVKIDIEALIAELENAMPAP